MSIQTGKCQVCGAHIPAKEVNEFDLTCDKICSRAKKASLTRQQEIDAEMIQAERYFAERLSYEARVQKMALVDLEDRYYNQPYLYLTA